jgi:serine/threonine-protein kinase
VSSFVDPGHRYELTRRIATGGMGEVWRATDTVLGREVAVKILKAEYADDAGFRARFETEARHAAALHHPNVAAVFDFGDGEDGRPFLVMELVEGQPLSALLRPGKQMPPDQARDLLGQAADALAAAHAKGIVHRDVKPANLMVTPDRQVKITDFGIARAAAGMALTQTGQVMGTPQYLAPEQAEGGTATSASDVYSLGVVLFECLAGRRPFTGDSPVTTALAHIREPVPDLPANVPGDLAAVTRRALAKNPKERFRNAAEFAAALRNPSSVPPLVPPVTGTSTKETAVLTGLSAAGLSAAGLSAAGLGPAQGMTVESAGTGGPQPPRRRISRWWTLVPIVLLLALVGWALWQGLSNNDGTPSDNNTSTPPTTRTKTQTQTTDQSINLTQSDCRGSIDVVTARLQGMNLTVNPDEQSNPGGETPGAVIGCSPSGNVQPGEQITVTYWGPQPTHAPSTPTDTGSPSGSPSDTGSPTTSTTTSPAAAGNPLSTTASTNGTADGTADGTARGNQA